ncbi:chaperone modulator CbpM [Nitrosomonas sp. Nm33]|uniref:chaperone modulator CbpM n=1 Tax=Nitrosomonas sp. Nm33 TaxID=133724 RepID=UPI00089C0F2F|nr:chaperone modulator CbpM [Nitrosomonas sp. Nm33]SDX89170.1 chaperone modulatory protein CbpM [Nitrosomonas sp. Nm33]
MTINHDAIDGIIVEDDMEFSFGELSHICAVNAEWIISLVEEGILEPMNITSKQWRFSGACLRRVQVIQRLQKDLGVNLAGAALALQLLEEVEILRTRLSIIKSSDIG